MDYAKQIILQLLTEEVTQDKVIYAIKKRHEVSFIYDSGDGNPKGKRERITVQPVAYGLTKSGNPCFRAYQINGSSETAEEGKKPLPGWRLFLLNGVKDETWIDSGKVFKEPPMYNPNGDNSMSQVYVIANFAQTQQRYERGGLKNYNAQRHAANVEKNPFYDLEKQIKNKRMAPDFVMKNIADTAKSKEEREAEWNAADAERRRGNVKSIADMSRQKDFGNNNGQTLGPVKKNVPQTNSGEEEETDYSGALENGPKYKETVENK